MAKTPKSNNSERVAPILRWIGGKRQLVDHLVAFLPADIANLTYREPFLGAGWLFFALNPRKAILSDANEHLINCYESVRDCWDEIARHLRRHISRDSEDYYYRVRLKYNSAPFSAEQAARFIYLNKACFNGIFRVNQKGNFNVPYGWKDRPAVPNADQLRRASDVLRRASLHALSFEQALRSVSRNDFVYLDPPYPPLNGETAYFTHYTKDRFDDADQRRLAAIVRTLDKRSCRFMMTNADTAVIRGLYRGFRIYRLPVTRFVTCKSRKHQVYELVITNYTKVL